MELTEERAKVLGALIGLARATEGNEHLLLDTTAALTREALRSEPTGQLLERLDGEKRRMVPNCYQCAMPCGRTENYDLRRLERLDGECRALKMRIIRALGNVKENTDSAFLYRALYAIGMEDWGREELLPIVQMAEQL